VGKEAHRRENYDMETVGEREGGVWGVGFVVNGVVVGVSDEVGRIKSRSSNGKTWRRMKGGPESCYKLTAGNGCDQKRGEREGLTASSSEVRFFFGSWFESE
jgi:hypothetical protein